VVHALTVRARFDGLDRLKAVALWAMLLHHLLAWSVGDARELLGDAEAAVTDLAAPAFAVAAGAGAVVVGTRLRRHAGAGTAKVLGRWAVIAGWGVLLGVRGDHSVDTVGVLETLALVGVVVTLLARWAAPTAVAWAAIAAGLTLASTPVIEAAADAGGWWHAAFGLRFPWVSYLAMAAAGAAVATALGDRERLSRLVPAAAGATLLLAVLALLHVGVWPLDRYPSGPAFIVPGVVAALVTWTAVAALPASALTRGMQRAGQRTLLVYVGHHVVRAGLDAGGWYQALEGPGWTGAVVALTVLIAVASALPWPVRNRIESPVAQGGEPRGTGTLAGSRK
jgi:hypothetical protein